MTAASEALAAPQWSATSGEDRASYIDALSVALKSRTDDLAACAAQEIAAPYGFCKGQVAMARMTLKFYGQLARDYEFEERRTGYFGQVLVRKEPVGVVAAIVPFNGPLFAAMLKIGAGTQQHPHDAGTAHRCCIHERAFAGAEYGTLRYCQINVSAVRKEQP